MNSELYRSCVWLAVSNCGHCESFNICVVLLPKQAYEYPDN